jgi:SAM-dependent methyltransferase
VARRSRQRASFFVAVLADKHLEHLPLLLSEVAAASFGYTVHVSLFLTPGGAREGTQTARKVLTRHGWHLGHGGLAEALEAAQEHGSDCFVFLEDSHAIRPDFFALALEVAKDERTLLSRGAFLTKAPGLASSTTPHSAALVSSRLKASPPPPPVVETLVVVVKAPEPKVVAKPLRQPAPVGARRASFLVATHHRPDLLRLCLTTLKAQEVPEGWSVEILVGGRAADLGKAVAEEFGATYLPVDHDWVTHKINVMVNHARGELLLLADDDDLQPPNRLAAAVRAHDRGADYSASGRLWFYDIEHDRLTQWVGPPALVGTSMSIRTSTVKAVRGWPLIGKGKDGPMAKRLREHGALFADLSGEIGDGLVALQHGANIWRRPVVEKGATARKGSFEIKGFGTEKENCSRFEGVVGSLLWGLSDPGDAERHPRTVSVLIGAYKAGRWVEAAVRSVLDQQLPEGWHMEVIVGVDGCPSTLEVVRKINDPRLGIVNFTENRGTYITFNSLLPYAKGSMLARFDADDIMLPGRLLRMVECMVRDPRLGMVGTWYKDVQEDLTFIRQRPWTPDGVWMWRRSVWDTKIGGFQPWRCAADAEAVLRAEHLGIRSEAVRELLYLRRDHQQQLTSAPETNFSSQVRREKTLFIRKARLRYEAGAVPERLSPMRVKGHPEGGLFCTDITVSMASIPSREETLKKVVWNLLHYVDHVNIYLNGYTHVPVFLGHPKITVARSQDHGDLGDAGKFFWADSVRGYHLTCDDDILYPPDYVSTMVAGIEYYKRGVVVSFHASVLLSPFESYIKSRKSLRFGRYLAEHTPAHVLGTGVLGYHTSTLRVSRHDFKAPNMADIWLAGLGQNQQVPFVCLQHRGDWLAEAGAYYHDSIFHHSHSRKATGMNTADRQTQVCEDHMPWQLFDPNTYQGTPMSDDYYNRFYRKGGWNYSKDLELARLRAHVLPSAGWVPGDAVLEIGCGLGFHSALLHDEGFKVVGVDISADGIRKAQEAWVGPEFVCKNLAEFAPDGKLHGILCRGMSWYHYNLSPNLRARTARMFDWLEPGGTFVLQIATNFSGDRPEKQVHHNTVDDYLSFFAPLGNIVAITDWDGKQLRSGSSGAHGVIVTVRKESEEYKERTFWEDNYRRGLSSGYGSRGDEATWKLAEITRIAREFKVESLTDFGSGDGHLAFALNEVLPAIRYRGIDIAPTAVQANTARALPNQTFEVGDFGREFEAPADMVLCIDVLFHQATQERHDAVIANVCKNFRKVAVIVVWNEKIVSQYGGKFDHHCFYRPFKAPPGIKATTLVLPMEPAKELILLTREG